ncbi:triphosphoribosyl-dephospho-CoA synthase MdcB [Rhizobium laguerreae]|uniref:triphosphoribosyl-dephospho-CoA synthase MdcB n=1 Tax=Rhizobium laguerreae TaxID=1076926 RepID=UPI001C92451B|nr:triphosphoribosyl-dephospho-CoA synthase MdcB [Rhizobium laguerreae]MBY3307695.1 triphosphoribosyl-dephospho-CoA synthase MdcB [Rhizobium laguerreae]
MTQVLTTKASSSVYHLSSLSKSIGRLAIRALYGELSLYPKPGLVSPIDAGAHADMDITTFMRSLFSLRSYFPQIAELGARGEEFHALRSLALTAEKRMMLATGSVNTHRGAIFNLGLLSAAAGYCRSKGLATTAEAVCSTVTNLWGSAILASAVGAPVSNGLRVRALYGGTGAREAAATGFPVVLEVALPVFRSVLANGSTRADASLHALFSVMAVLQDTNILHRGGPAGLSFVQDAARGFLSNGGIYATGAHESAIELHKEFSRRRLSPGGAADMLACTTFLFDIEASQ